jgi:2-polyprenyl-3-methyl-5-hydroxy-6-metoxy-1,4-benzoquinol methylase
LAYAIVILGAEYLTRVVPQGTHDYDKFIRPEQLTKLLQDHGCEILDVQGFAYNPLNNTMCESNDKSVNYFVSAKKL